MFCSLQNPNLDTNLWHMLMSALCTVRHPCGLLQDNFSIYIQITDDCPCLSFDYSSATPVLTGVTPLFCTTVTHFQLDYQAFEQLAHPDYGLLSLRFRSVSICQHLAASNSI